MELLMLLLLILGWLHGKLIHVHGGLRAFAWTKNFLQPGRFTNPKQILRRAQLVTGHQFTLLLLPVMVTLPMAVFLVGYGVHVAHFYHLSSFYIGYLWAHIKPRNLVNQSIDDFLAWMPKLAARSVAQHCPEPEAIRFLGELFYSEIDNLQAAALAGLAVLGPEKAAKVMELLQKQKSERVRLQAQQLQSMFADPAYGKVTIPNAHRLSAIEELRRWRGVLRRSLFKRNAIRSNIFESMTSIDGWVWNQSEINRSHPHTFCKACLTRGEEVRFDRWKWVQCRNCKESSNLVTGVETVVGQIGGSTSWTLDGHRLLLSVWDENAKKPLPADLDALELIGGKQTDLDWAASAVVEAMTNREMHLAQGFQTLIPENVPLSSNTKAILARLAPK